MFGSPFRYFGRRFMGERRIEHRWLMVFFELLTLVLLVIQITGCISSTAAGPSLYLVQFQYQAFANPPLVASDGIVNDTAYNQFNDNAQGTSLKVRVGYFGVCSQDLSESNSTQWVCGKDVTSQTSRLAAKDDPYNIIYTAFALKSGGISAWVLIIGAISTAISCVTLWMTKSAQFLGLPVATLFVFGGWLFITLGMVWQQVFSNTSSKLMSVFTGGAVQGNAGVTLAGLGWSSVVFITGCFVGLIVLFYDEKTIEAETGERHGVTRGSTMTGMPPMRPAMAPYAGSMIEPYSRAATPIGAPYY